MKSFGLQILLPVIFTAALFLGCESDEKEKAIIIVPTIEPVVKKKDTITSDHANIPAGAINGDFDGNRLKEYAWFVPPDSTKCGECDGDCSCFIKFSDSSITPIKIERAIGGTPNNLGDLNGDGSDEIGFLPEWCTSCWQAYFVFTFKKTKWINAVDPISTHCVQWEDKVVPVEVDKKRKGYVIVRSTKLDDADFKVVERSVRIK